MNVRQAGDEILFTFVLLVKVEKVDLAVAKHHALERCEKLKVNRLVCHKGMLTD